MGKLPAIQLYPGDWLQDAIAGCSLAAQGLWLRMMFLAHSSDRYGYLSQYGKPLPPAVIARRCACSLEQYLSLLAELDDAGVPSRSRSGLIYSRRMVRDDIARAQNRQRQQLFRDTSKSIKLKENSNADVTPMSRRSSSSSSTSTSNKTKDYCTEPEKPVSMPPSGVLETLPLNHGEGYDITEESAAKWQKLYPAVDVIQQCRNIKGWCEANPTRRKTRRGVARFINAWLAKEQDKGGSSNGSGSGYRSNGRAKTDGNIAAMLEAARRMGLGASDGDSGGEAGDGDGDDAGALRRAPEPVPAAADRQGGKGAVVEGKR